MGGRKMPTTIKKERTGRIVVGMDPELELSIKEVARFTGYSTRQLLRIEGKSIPKRHFDDRDNLVWFAKEMVNIREHRKKMKGMA